MPRTVELDIASPDADVSPSGEPTGRRRDGAGLVFPDRVRLLGSAAVAAVAVAAVALTSLVPDGRNGYVVAHALPAIPLLAASFVWAGRVRRRGAPEYAAFWGHWRGACACGLGAALAGTASPVWAPLLEIDLALMVAAVPFWALAGREALAIPAGRLDPAVDMVDGLTAIAVLGAPGVLLLAEPLLTNAQPAVALPLAFFLALVPAGLYGAVLSIGRVPPGERVTHALGIALVGTFCVSVALQLVRLVGGVDLPPAVVVAAHVANLSVVAALPLWSHREMSGGLGRLPVERQVRRRNPMPVLCAAVLPVVATYVLGWRRHDVWAVGYLVGLLLVVVALSAVRQTMLTRETRRLAGELAQMAEERRGLLADMVRALDDDRRRIVSELHAQAVGSLSTLGTVVQTMCVSLPAPTALAVRESVAQVQGDLNRRAEELRTLLVALRPFGAAGTGDDALGPALRAYAADLCDALPPEARPQRGGRRRPRARARSPHGHHRLPHRAGGPAHRGAPRPGADRDRPGGGRRGDGRGRDRGRRRRRRARPRGRGRRRLPVRPRAVHRPGARRADGPRRPGHGHLRVQPAGRTPDAGRRPPRRAPPPPRLSRDLSGGG